MNVNIREETVDLGFENPLIQAQPSILIGQTLLTEEEMHILGGEVSRELFIFAAKIPLSHPRYPDAWQMEFLVKEISASGLTCNHHLFQDKSAFYTCEKDQHNGTCADMLKAKDIRFLRHRPKWKVSEASIPNGLNGLYYFVSQFYIPQNPSTLKFLCSGDAIFLFVEVRNNDTLSIKLFCQDMSAQTAEEHYRLEEMMSEFDRHPHDQKKAEALIRKGDKDFHRFVLEHPRIRYDILLLLLKHAKPKNLRTEIERKLRIMHQTHSTDQIKENLFRT